MLGPSSPPTPSSGFGHLTLRAGLLWLCEWTQFDPLVILLSNRWTELLPLSSLLWKVRVIAFAMACRKYVTNALTSFPRRSSVRDVFRHLLCAECRPAYQSSASRFQLLHLSSPHRIPPASVLAILNNLHFSGRHDIVQTSTRGRHGKAFVHVTMRHCTGAKDQSRPL